MHVEADLSGKPATPDYLSLWDEMIGKLNLSAEQVIGLLISQGVQ